MERSFLEAYVCYSFIFPELRARRTKGTRLGVLGFGLPKCKAKLRIFPKKSLAFPADKKR
jgi:hypothetical protein